MTQRYCVETLTFRVLNDSSDVVAGAEGGDGGQSDFVGHGDLQVRDGVGHQDALLWLLPPEVNLLDQLVQFILDGKKKKKITLACVASDFFIYLLKSFCFVFY